MFKIILWDSHELPFRVFDFQGPKDQMGITRVRHQPLAGSQILI